MLGLERRGVHQAEALVCLHSIGSVETHTRFVQKSVICTIFTCEK